jgi:Uma2 family endonuclease
MTLSSSQLQSEVFYPDSDGEPMAESDSARNYLIYGVEALNRHFQNQDNVYVSGNLFIYYEKGIPSSVIAPDVFVVFGVEKKERGSYKVWQEGDVVPSFVLEVTSETTKKNDEEVKPQKYSRLGVQEYFQYDPTGDYLNPPLKGSTLVMGNYQALTLNLLPDGVLSIHSTVLGLDLRVIGGELRFYDPKTGKTLLSSKELEQARQQAEFDRQQAKIAQQQAERAQRDAIPRMLDLGLSEEQVASVLSLSVEEVRQFFQDR